MSSLHLLAERWSSARAAERANAQLYLVELADALGVERPRPAGSGFEFEFPVKVGKRDGTDTTNFVDLYRQDHFLLEAKDQEGGKADHLLLQRAFGQARMYATSLPGTPPPYLLVLDVGKTLLVWDRWSGSYGGFNAARRIDLRTLAERPEDAAFLRDIWECPQVRNPRTRQVAITKERAEDLAKLSARLEARGYEQERVARFLMRCVFTMFAEDVGLLDGSPFENALQDIGLRDPVEFAEAMQELWQAMDEGKRFGLKRLLRFNGHFFKDAEVLPLEREDLKVLLEAARADWAEVEPTIFGTLLTRALDPQERHKLGAEYTPREFVERVVRPTVEEPIRQRWMAVQAEVLQLRDPAGKKEARQKEDRKQALARLREFHDWMRGLRFLDPACGSGNFLYVTMAMVKRIELEVLREIEAVRGDQAEMHIEEVGPWQFCGIEIKPWAREIAELTLWIGYHQFWKANHGGRNPPEPVLQDTGTLECRDAVLSYTGLREDPERSRPDPTPRLKDPVTGRIVPDPKARLAYWVHENALATEWPRADFIVGNPPYLGQARQRDAFGDGYVEALRAAYPEVPESADLVMYWWWKAVERIAAGETIRAGFITTNTIVQAQNRVLIEKARKVGVGVGWAVADHPWVDEAGAANVRVTMTVLVREAGSARLVKVDEHARIVGEVEVERLNADLSAHADVATASGQSLQANAVLCSPGFKLEGAGFILSQEQAAHLIQVDNRCRTIIKSYRNGRDLTSRPREAKLIDFGMMLEQEASEYPILFDLVRARVKPERDARADVLRRDNWWRLGRPREQLREALKGLHRYIATVETAKHRFFIFLEAEIAPDNRLVCIASSRALHLGVLTSSIHKTWASAAGGKLEDRPVYSKGTCFDAFPFPQPSLEVEQRLEMVAEKVDMHRKDAIARHESITMTGMYNVVEKLKSGEALTVAEQKIHTLAACGVLKDLHEELDRLVAEAYGWQWPMSNEEILSRLVELHDERVREEAAGQIRWLRPEYQKPKFGAGTEIEMEGLEAPEKKVQVFAVVPKEWPEQGLRQLEILQEMLSEEGLRVDDVLQAYPKAKRPIVERHLETFALLGEAHKKGDRYHLTMAQAA